jgi:PiT family inorganic phosphate transporter
MGSILNGVGAFISLKVAATVASGIVSQTSVILPVVFAGLAGAIVWNITTWLFGIPSSSSHALVGGMIGAMMVHAGGSAVLWGGLTSKVLFPSLAAPLFAFAIAALATLITRALSSRADDSTSSLGLRVGQIGASALLSIAHGTNDAQKTMGVITLALIANGTIGANAATPHWVVIVCAVAIAAGTAVGGWRIIRTLGKGLTSLTPAEGFASQMASSTVILTSSHFGLPLSTTYVATGAVLGAGTSAKGQTVRWGLARRVVLAWLITIPSAGICGGLVFGFIRGTGTSVGVTVALVAVGALAVVAFLRSRADRITSANVNDDWGTHNEGFEHDTAEDHA